jgi:transcriptional regulator with XRE-family HTH domain
MKTFADRLKAARERAGLTQGELATLLGVHRFTVSKWEQGLHPPGKPTDMENLGYNLNCSVAWLRDGTGEMGSYVPTTDRARRQDVVRRARPKAGGMAIPTHPGGRVMHGSADRVDWSLVALCASLLIEAQASLDIKALARALPLFYSMALRSPGVCDAEMAMQILQATE